MGIFLGIDGGATKTTCAVGDEIVVLGTAISGGSSILRLGEAQARESIQGAILKACAVAKVDPRTVDLTCIGITGSSVPEVREAVARFVREVASGSFIVLADFEIALQAALGGKPGLIVESGSGSFAFGRNESGQTARAGGHGCQISDEGSGYWIGRTAVTAALRALDAGDQMAFFTQLANGLGARSRNELVKIANGSPTPDFATLFPAVGRAADAGDPTAIDVLRRAGTELGQVAMIVIRRLWPNESNVRVCLVGGVFQSSQIVRDEFCKTIHALRTGAEITLSDVDPVLGALSIARENAKGLASAKL